MCSPFVWAGAGKRIVSVGRAAVQRGPVRVARRTDDVDPARGPRHFLDGGTVLLLELLKDRVPALAFVHEGGRRVDLVERVDERER